MTDTFTDELATRLQSQRDDYGAAATMPTIEALLDRPAPPARLGSTRPRRRTTTIALAAAAVMLLVVGVLALTRDDTQRVSTLPSSEVRRLAGPGTPFLLPPGGDAVAEFVPDPSDNLETAQIPGMVNGTIETLISGDVGDEAKLLTLVITGPRDDTMMDPFSSLRGSDTFDPGDWFDHPDDYPTEGISTTTELPVTSYPGADRAVLATTPDRPSVVAIRRGTQRIAVFGRGVTDRQLSDVAAGLRFDDDPAQVDFGAVPRGFQPLVPRATNPKRFDGYSARASGMSVTVTNASGAAFDAAASLLSGVSTPGWTALRGGPDWVLQLTDNPRQLRGCATVLGSRWSSRRTAPTTGRSPLPRSTRSARSTSTPLPLPWGRGPRSKPARNARASRTRSNESKGGAAGCRGFPPAPSSRTTASSACRRRRWVVCRGWCPYGIRRRERP